MTRFFMALLATLLLNSATLPGAQAQDPTPAATGAETRDEAPADGEKPADEKKPKKIQINLNLVLAEARGAVRAGNLQRAIQLYQLVLRFAPTSRIARIELSFALTALGERNRAARLLSDVDREGLPPDVIATIDRIVGPGRVNFFLIPQIIYENNINNQTTKSVIYIKGVPFTLSEDAKGRSAYGYGLTFGAAIRLRNAQPRTTLTLGTRVRDLTGRIDDSADLFGSLSFAFDLAPRTTFVPSLSGAYRTRADERYETEYAGGAALGFPIGPVRTTLSGRYRVIDGLGLFEGLRDRRRAEATLGLGYGLPGVGLRWDNRVYRENWTETNTQDQDGITTGLDFILIDVPVIMPTVGAAVAIRRFENEAPFFDVERFDREYEGHLELLFRDFKLFGTGAPTLRYTFRHATSNIPLFEYNEHEFSVGFKAITF